MSIENHDARNARIVRRRQRNLQTPRVMLFGFRLPRGNFEWRNEGALGIGQQIHELHFGEIAYNLYCRESSVVDADAPEMLQLRTEEVAKHRANDVAMRDE